MNNQEATFAIKFVVKDLAKIRKATDEVNKKLDAMKQRSEKASKGINKIQGSLGKATKAVLKFALAYFALSKIINSAFSKANEAIQIDMMAASAGVAAEKIGKLGKALRIYGGDAKSAGSAYSSLTNIIGGATHGHGISEDVARVNAMFGIGFNYGNITQDQLMTNIAVAMKRLKGQNDQWGINQIASAYGLDAPMANFLAEQGANWSNKANAEKWQKLSKSESQQLIESQEALNEQFAQLSKNVIPGLVKGMEVLNATIEMITPFVESIARRFGYKDKDDEKAEKFAINSWEKHKDEFLAWEKEKKGKSLTLTTVPAHKDNFERAEYVMGKLKESNFNLNVLAEYTETAKELERNYGKEYGYNIGMMPKDNGSAVITVQVGDIVLKNETDYKLKATGGKTAQVINRK